MIFPSRRTENYHYAIRNLARAAEALEQTGREVIYLNIGDPQRYGFRPPDCVIESVTRAIRDGFTGYSHSAGILEARVSIAEYASRMGAVTGPSDVILTSGASEAADIVLTALVNEGDEVLLPAPGYPIYPAIMSKLGARSVYYTLDQSGAWRPSVDEVRSLVSDRTRAIVLINPNNPTGSITPDETTRRLIEMAVERNLLVISDEVYRELCFGEQPSPSSVIAQEMGAPLITLESLSKTHMVPGWRVGWMRYTHPEKMRDLASAINRLADGRLCSPTATQYAIRPALEGSRDYLPGFMKEIRRRRDISTRRAARIPGLSCVEPEAAFYMVLKTEDLRGRTDERFVLDLLAETGVLVVHGSGFGAAPSMGYFRLVYLAGEETLNDAFDRIEGYLGRA
ncbi:MAG TPA: aminotransferase class I/II-fold pyridoxal phosphate-dependent enzyme [Blastocatellia bacterium]|nr:aminotransferase class I/II-fold pyridoxal phosphate-dependent enzyme [Blastocatellia bacterium]